MISNDRQSIDDPNDWENFVCVKGCTTFSFQSKINGLLIVKDSSPCPSQLPGGFPSYFHIHFRIKNFSHTNTCKYVS